MTSEKTLFSRFSELIGQPVRVHVQDGTATAGVLYCIDPETDDVALLVSSGHVVLDYSVKIVLAHDVQGIQKEGLDESCSLPTLASLEREVAKENDRDGERDAAVSQQQRREELIQFLSDVRSCDAICSIAVERRRCDSDELCVRSHRNVCFRNTSRLRLHKTAVSACLEELQRCENLFARSSAGTSSYCGNCISSWTASASYIRNMRLRVTLLTVGNTGRQAGNRCRWNWPPRPIPARPLRNYAGQIS